MPALNIKCLCQVCQREEYTVPAVDITSMTNGEILDALEPTLNKAGWALRKHFDKRIDRYLVCPKCIEVETKTVGALSEYKPSTDCPKCGCEKLLTKYRHGLETGALVPVEHLERECERCKYKFPQRPLGPTVTPG